MYCTILDDILLSYHNSRWKYRMTIFSTIAIAIGSTTAVLTFIPNPQVIAGVISINILSFLGVNYWQNTIIKSKIQELISMDGKNGIQSVYKRIYSRKIADSDEYTMDLWRKVKYHFDIGWVREGDIETMKRISEKDFELLKYIIEVDIPGLRRRTAPELTTPNRINIL